MAFERIKGADACDHNVIPASACPICHPRTHEAYAVMFIGTSTTPATVLGASIFSEPQPTVDGPLRVVSLFKVTGESYAAAAEAAWQVLKSLPFDWLGKLDHPKHTRIAVMP